MGQTEADKMSLYFIGIILSHSVAQGFSSPDNSSP